MNLYHVDAAELAYVAEREAGITLLRWMLGQPLALDYAYAMTGGN